LRLISWTEAEHVFWACSAQSCAYQEYPAQRRLAPELCITLHRRQGVVEVAPMPGAEDAVRFCGGIAAVLTAAGVDMRRAVPLPPEDAIQSAQASKPGPAEAASDAVARLVGDGLQAAAPNMLQQAEGESNIAAAVTAGSSSSGQASQGASIAQADSRPGSPAAPSTRPQAGTAKPTKLQPLRFPQAEYERLKGCLQQFGRQTGVVLLPSAGMIPDATLAAARQVAYRQLTSCETAWAKG
jgi:hypothetical protein